jgi:hypothetical protein
VAKSVPCPKCRQPIAVAKGPDGRFPERLACTACGKSFRVQGSSPPPPAAPAPTPAAEPTPAAASLDPWEQPESAAVARVESIDAASSEPDTYGFAQDEFADEGDSWLADAGLDGEDLEAEAPGGLPPRHGKVGSGKSPGSKSKLKSSKPVGSDSTSSLASRRNLLIGGGVGAAALVGIAIWAVIGSGDAAGPAAEGAAAVADVAAQPDGNAAGGKSGQPAVFDQPVAGVAAVPAPPDPHAPKLVEFRWVDTTPLTEDASAPPPAIAEQPASSGRRTPAVAEAPTAPADETPLWQAEPDPRPADAEYTIAADIRFALTSPGEHRGNVDQAHDRRDEPLEIFPTTYSYGTAGQIPPTLASQQGPYLIVPPTWEQVPTGWKLLPKKTGRPIWRDYEYVDHSPGDIPVIDLRTGQPAGNFDFRIPFWLRPALSPDGKTLVGPYHRLPIPDIDIREETEEEKDRRRHLYVWRRDEHEEPLRLDMTGELSSITFADDRTLLVLVEAPARQLEIWNIADGTKTAVVDLPQPLTCPEKPDKSLDPRDLQRFPPETPNVLAASPGGRYAAVASAPGLVLISLADARILGVAPWPNFTGLAVDVMGLEFLPSGTDIVAVYRHNDQSVNTKTRFKQIDLTTGVTKRLHDGTATTRGPLMMSPDGNSYILMSFPEPFNRSLTWGDYDRYRPTLYDLERNLAENTYQPPTILRNPAAGPLLVVRQRLDGRPDAPEEIPVIATMSREAHLAEIEPVLAVDEHGLVKRVRAPVADLSNLQRLESAPPAEWTPLSFQAAPAAAVANLGPVHWPIAWGGGQALSVRGAQGNLSGYPAAAVLGQLVDLSAPQEAPPAPFELLAYGLKPNQSTYGIDLQQKAFLPAGISPAGDRFAIADPDELGRVEVWSTARERQFAFRTSPQPRVRTEWVEFASSERLLTLEEGVLTGWDLAADSARGAFTLDGHYQVPGAFSPDHSLLAISRGKSFDLISPTDGQCLGRCGADGTGTVIDFAFGPDGRRLAVVYEANDSYVPYHLTGKQFDSYAEGRPQNRLVIWDLQTGQGRTFEPNGLEVFNRVVWLGPEHLGLATGGISIVDLKLNRVAVECPAAAKSPDDRLWIAEQREQPPSGESPVAWRLASLTGKRTEEEELAFAADRAVVDPQATPIRFEIDLGDSRLSKQHGAVLLPELQKQGWKIGPGGNTLRVTRTIGDEGREIEFKAGRAMIPQLYYTWRLLDSAGREIAANATVGRFSFDKSRYSIKPDYETRTRTGADFYFDFGSKDPRTAMIEEIEDSGSGLQTPPPFPAIRYFANGKYMALPVKTEMPAAK